MARYLHVADITVDEMIREGRLPALEVRPGLYRISRAAVDRLLHPSSHPTDAPAADNGAEIDRLTHLAELRQIDYDGVWEDYNRAADMAAALHRGTNADHYELLAEAALWIARQLERQRILPSTDHDAHAIAKELAKLAEPVMAPIRGSIVGEVMRRLPAGGEAR